MTRITSITILFAILGLALAGCGTTSGPPPTVVQTKEVPVPVPVRCSPYIGPEPAYPDADAALKAAPDLVTWGKDLEAGRALRIARDQVKTAALAACEGVADPTTVGTPPK